MNLGGLDLGASAEQNRQLKAQERMTAFQMLLEAHSRGLNVLVSGDEKIIGTATPKANLAAVHDAVVKWQRYIFEGTAIGS